MARKHPFGARGSLPPGRVQAMYFGPDGRRYKGPHSLRNRQQAARGLGTVRTEINLGGLQPKDESLAGLHYLRVPPATGRGLEASTKVPYRQLLATQLSPFSRIPPPCEGLQVDEGNDGEGGQGRTG